MAQRFPGLLVFFFFHFFNRFAGTTSFFHNIPEKIFVRTRWSRITFLSDSSYFFILFSLSCDL